MNLQCENRCRQLSKPASFLIMRSITLDPNLTVPGNLNLLFSGPKGQMLWYCRYYGALNVIFMTLFSIAVG